MDKRLMVKASDQQTHRFLNCDKCNRFHYFKYSHLKHEKGKRYIVYYGVGCFQEYLIEV